jgi:KipI family sensor histidine kinase inhibitor
VGGDRGGEQAGEATAWVLPVVRAAQDRWPAATVVAGLASVLVAFDSPADRPDEASLLRGWAPPGPGTAPDSGTRVLRIPIRYDGPDLADVARGLGLTPAELAARHSTAEWTVAALGFSPGFGYLSSPDPLFRSVPRRADPRRRVPAGTLAIAAGMSAVYPSATPGGWNLIGTTDAVLFDAGRVPPALLRVGDRVAFQERP